MKLTTLEELYLYEIFKHADKNHNLEVLKQNKIVMDADEIKTAETLGAKANVWKSKTGTAIVYVTNVKNAYATADTLEEICEKSKSFL
jgi:hypothetical protein